MISKQVCVVSDTSPLSAMAKMGWLPWLQERWRKVLDCIAELRRITRFRISDEVLGRIAIDLGEIP